MIITCTSIDEFIECLEAEKAVFQGVVRVSIVRQPFDKGNRDSTIYEVVLQASAVVLVDEESQYMLQVGIACGKDYCDATQEMGGSEKAKELKSRLQQFAESRGWKILPGIIGF